MMYKYFPTFMDSSFREFLAKIRLERWIEEWTLELIEGRQSDEEGGIEEGQSCPVLIIQLAIHTFYDCPVLTIYCM